MASIETKTIPCFFLLIFKANKREIFAEKANKLTTIIKNNVLFDVCLFIISRILPGKQLYHLKYIQDESKIDRSQFKCKYKCK